MNKEFLEKLKAALSDHSARDFSLLPDNKFIITPHRVDDSRDDDATWVFKVQSWVNGKLIDTHLL